MSSERISCGEFLVVDLDDAKQVNQQSINTKSMSTRLREDYERRIAAYTRLNPTAKALPTMPRLSIDTLMNLSAKYEKAHPGKKLAHAFPSNDQTSKLPPRSQHTQSGGGLAIPYQNDQQSKMTRDSRDPPIRVTPVPATFYEGENQDHKTQQEIIKHYIAGLYFQAGLGNGICVPVRNINGYIGSVLNECDFTHPIKSSGAQSLLAGKEYAWGAGIDKSFCKNHGEFLEAELNKLDAFMSAMRNAPSREAQEKIIQALDNDYAIAFRNALANPEKEWYGMHRRGGSLEQTQTMVTGIAADISLSDDGNRGKKRSYDDFNQSKKSRSDEQNEAMDIATSAIVSSREVGNRGKKRSHDDDKPNKKRKLQDEPFMSASVNPIAENLITPFIQLQRNEFQLSLAGKLSPQQLQMVMESLAQASAKASLILSSTQQPETTENLWLSDPRLKRGKKDAANLTLFTQPDNPQAISTDQDAFVNMRDITAIGPQARHVTTISMVQKAFSRFITSDSTENPMLISDVIKALLLHRLDFFIEEIEPQNKLQKKLTRKEVIEMFFQYFLHDPKLMTGMRSKEVAEDIAARIFRLYSKAAYIALPEEGNTPVIKNESSVAANALKKFEKYDDSINDRMEAQLTQEELIDCIEQLYLIFDYKPLDPSTRAKRLSAIFGAVSIVNANTRDQQIPKELRKEYDEYVKSFIAITKASPKITQKDRKFIETIERKKVSTISGKELKEFERIMINCDIEYRKSNKYSNAVIDHWRHENEPIERLYEVTARHLNMMFLLCPSLEEYQRDAIVNGFLSKIANEYKMNEEERIALADNVLARLRDRNFDYDHAVTTSMDEVLNTEFTTLVDELVYVYQEEANDYVSELIEQLHAAEHAYADVLTNTEDKQIVTEEAEHNRDQNGTMMEVEQSDLEQHSVEMDYLSESDSVQLSDRLRQVDFNPIAEEIYQWQKRVNSETVKEIIKFIKNISQEEDVKLIKELQQGILKNKGLSAENIATILALLHKSTSLRQTDLINIVLQLEKLHIKVDVELVHAISAVAQRISQDDDIVLIKKLQEGPLKDTNLLDEDISMILNVLHKPYRDISEYDFNEILKTLYGQFQDRRIAEALIGQICNSVNGKPNKDVIASLEQELQLASPQFNDRSRAAILLYHQFLHGDIDSQEDDDDKSYGDNSEDSEDDVDDGDIEDFDGIEDDQEFAAASMEQSKESAGIVRSLDSENHNLDNQRDNQDYQLQSHDINYVAKRLIPDNVVYIDVQQAHRDNPAIGLVRTFSEEEGLVQQSLRQGKNIVSTFNKDGNHWVAFRLMPTQDGKLVVLYKDSYGAQPPAAFLQALESLKGQYSEIIFMPNHSHREQFDAINCGIFALKNMQLLASLGTDEINKWYNKESFPAFYQPALEHAEATSLYMDNIKKIRKEFGDIYRSHGEEMEVAAGDLREFVNQRQNLADRVASALSVAMMGQKFNMRCEARTVAGNTQEWRFDIEFVGATSEMQLLSVKRFLEQCEIACLVHGNHLQFSPEAGDKILALIAVQEMPSQSATEARETVLEPSPKGGDQHMSPAYIMEELSASVIGGSDINRAVQTSHGDLTSGISRNSNPQHLNATSELNLSALPFTEKNKSDLGDPVILAKCIAHARSTEELYGYLNRLTSYKNNYEFIVIVAETSRSLTIPIFSEAKDIVDLISKLNELPKDTVLPGGRFLIKMDTIINILQKIQEGANCFSNLPRSFGIRDAVKNLMAQTPKHSLDL